MKEQKMDNIQNIDDCKFIVKLHCGDCGTVLNNTSEMSMSEIWENWTRIVLSSGFVAGKCPSGCRKTFSDLNINTHTTIYDVATGKPFELQAYKFLIGKFYSEDYEKVCDCDNKADDEIYKSEKYPAVHGVCGKWITKYIG
jgi:hypothetical protein